MVSLLLALFLGPSPEWARIATEMVPGRTAYALNAVVDDGHILMFEEEGIGMSKDGIAWALVCPKRDMPGSPLIGDVVALDGTVYVLGTRRDGANASREVWRSLDGKSWKNIGETLPAIETVKASGEGLLWVVGSEGRVWSSRDGVAWSSGSKGGWDEPAAAIVRGRSLVVFDSEGKTWARPTESAEWAVTGSGGPWVGRWRPSFAVHGGAVWMVGGSDKTDYWTLDGGAWTRHALPAGWLPRATPRLVSLGGSLYVFGGKTGRTELSNPQDVWRIVQRP